MREKTALKRPRSAEHRSAKKGTERKTKERRPLVGATGLDNIE
jgi:hypothetical protein